MIKGLPTGNQTEAPRTAESAAVTPMSRAHRSLTFGFCRLEEPFVLAQLMSDSMLLASPNPHFAVQNLDKIG